MPAYKTTAIILRTYDFNDYDKIVVLYSQEYGLVRAIAKGAKRPKSPLRGRLEPTICAELILYDGKNLHNLTQCDITNPFKQIRLDLKKITFALYFLELAAAFAIENDPSSRTFFSIIYETLKSIEQASDNQLDYYLNIFEYKLITYAGYEPVFDLCTRCNSDLDFAEKLYFSPYLGSVVCSRCTFENAGLPELSVELYDYLKNLKQVSETPCMPDKTIVIKTHNILFNYISQKTNCKLKTPKLIESLCLG